MVQFKSVGGQKKYFKYAECEEGQLLVEGKFIGTSPNKFGKENFDFRPEEGPIVREGDTVQVIYDGKGILDKGAFKGKEVHNFKVNVAESLDVESVKKAQDNMKAQESRDVNLSDLD